jgi:hypothetical protein
MILTKALSLVGILLSMINKFEGRNLKVGFHINTESNLICCKIDLSLVHQFILKRIHTD